MQLRTYNLNDEISIELKEDPTGDDLLALKQLGIDPVFAPEETAAALLECHHDKNKMKDLINIISEKPVEELNKGVSGKKIFEALQDFFIPFGIHFRS